MKFRSVAFDERGWRKYLPDRAYSAIHGWRFKGATRLRQVLGLQPLDVENVISAFASAFTRADSIFLDIGAQHGRHVRAVLERGPESASAIAFEANPTLALKFESNFAEAFASGRLKIIHAAVAEESGTAEFFVNTFDSGYSGLVRREITEAKAEYSPCTVARVSLDEVCKTQEKPVSCIKIDVEGAEFGVLKGARKTLADSRPIILFECAGNAAPFYGYGLADIVSWLAERGFKTATINGQIINEKLAKLLFDSRSCYDFVAYPEERALEVGQEMERHCHAKLRFCPPL